MMRQDIYLKIKQLLVPFLMVLVLSSCELSGLGNPEKPTWEIGLVGPLVKTETLTLEDFEDFSSFSYEAQLPLDNPVPDAVAGQQIIIPSITSSTPFDPFAINIADLENPITIESGQIYFSVNNQFPINIKSGLTIEAASGGQEIFTHTTDADIAADGGTYQMSPVSLAGKTLSSDVVATVSGFASDGSGGNIITLPDPLLDSQVDIFIENVTVRNIQINQGTTYNVEQTTDFNLVGDEVDTELASGDLLVNVTNGMPLDIELQIAFLDVNGNFIANLWTDDNDVSIPQTISSAELNPDGTVLNTLKTKLSPASVDKISSFLIEAKKVRFSMSMSVPDGHNNVTVELDQGISLIVIGDLQIKLSK